MERVACQVSRPPISVRNETLLSSLEFISRPLRASFTELTAHRGLSSQLIEGLVFPQPTNGFYSSYIAKEKIVNFLKGFTVYDLGRKCTIVWHERLTVSAHSFQPTRLTLDNVRTIREKSHPFSPIVLPAVVKARVSPNILRK
jgi:hypothetical protein